MNFRHFSFLSLTTLISVLTGCVDNKETRLFDIGAFRSGKIKLHCTSLACAGSWGTSSAKIQELYKNHLWHELARLVVSHNYDSDLAYFYLGRAAEGMGEIHAARTYYESSYTAKLDCDGLVNVCQGIAVPETVSSRLSNLNRGSSNQGSNVHHIDIRQAQLRLKQLGYYSGRVDGLYGPRTASAIREFQRTKSLSESGVIDADTAKLLKGEAPVSIDERKHLEPSNATKRSLAAEVVDEQKVISMRTSGELISNAELLKSADPFADVVMKLGRGDKVNIIGNEGEWMRVEHRGNLGYIYADQLK